MARLLYCEFAKKIYEVPDDYERDPTLKSCREFACCPACGDNIRKPTLGYYHSLWRSKSMAPKEIREEAKKFLYYYHMTGPKRATKRRRRE